MNKKNNLLIEIGTEELPPNQILNLSKSFIQNISKNIKKHNINFNKIKQFYTPRRIAIILYDIPTNTKEINNIIKGPKKNSPKDIITKFIKIHNLKINDLKTKIYKNEEYYIYEKIITKKKTLNLLSTIIKDSIYEIHIYKKMRWSNIEKPFVRPVKWIIANFNNKKIFLEIYNIKTNNISYGHSLLHNKGINIIPYLYEKILEKCGKIIPCPKKRILMIENFINNIRKNTKIFIENNNNLINDNINITEYPTILVGNYSKKLLQIPEELIINVIEKQQKCFLIKNNNKTIINKFIIISNTYKRQENIIKNYQKVITARLKDIIFLLNEILNIYLIKNLDILKNIIFHKKLGSLYNKTLRIKIIATHISYNIRYNYNIIKTISLLTKSDLTTKIVKNFPELHGIIGYNLSKKTKLNKNISIALKEQTIPKFYKDKIPSSITGSIISISDKIDTIIGFFNINILPSGSKDPYSLKRLIIGIINILTTNNIKIILSNIITLNEKCYKQFLQKTAKKNLFLLFIKRWKYFYEDNYNTKEYTLHNYKNLLIYNSNRYIKEINVFLMFKKFLHYIKIHNRINKLIINNKIKYKNKTKKNLLKTKYEYILSINITKLFILKKYYKNINIKYIIKYIILPTKHYLNNILIFTNNEKIKKNRLKICTYINKFFFIFSIKKTQVD
ncbi:MAG: glycine--tRNA ligase subunit beta [Candidatus Azosocius agrarius]|nr:MAG: glycine--tRNA ligase subunit beta [Gammaproteobacteria bacterium]